jgi:hypothetical protein
MFQKTTTAKVVRYKSNKQKDYFEGIEKKNQQIF